MVFFEGRKLCGDGLRAIISRAPSHVRRAIDAEWNPGAHTGPPELFASLETCELNGEYPDVKPYPQWLPGKIYKECKRFIIYGLLGLALGSALLLVRKIFAVPEFWADLSVYAGGCILLCSNSSIIFGLLIFAGKRDQT